MSAGRLLSMLLLLQAKGRVTAQALAEQFEVSTRTIYRDIDQLSAAGVPVYADRGPGGGFALLEGYRTRLTGMTADEVETLSIAGLQDVASELGLSDRLRDAQLKLAAALPKASAASSRIASRLHVDPIDWFQQPNATPHLPQVAHAVWEQRRLSLHYAGWMAAGERVIEPLGLVLKGGDWYLLARRRVKLRVYKVANISRLRILEETFEPPAKFNLREEWLAAVARFETGLLEETATLRVSREGMTRLHHLGAPALAQAAYGPADAEGWQEVTLPVERRDYAAQQIYAMGPAVEVLKPPGLRIAVRRLAEAVVAVYGEPRHKRQKPRPSDRAR